MSHTRGRTARSGAWRPLTGVLAFCLLGAGAALPGVPLADDAAKSPPPEPADVELLEFLGSVGSEDQAWKNYVAQTDAAKASKVAAAKTTPPANGGKKNDNNQTTQSQ